jgi:hypothetical protein
MDSGISAKAVQRK